MRMDKTWRLNLNYIMKIFFYPFHWLRRLLVHFRPQGWKGWIHEGRSRRHFLAKNTFEPGRGGCTVRESRIKHALPGATCIKRWIPNGFLPLNGGSHGLDRRRASHRVVIRIVMSKKFRVIHSGSMLLASQTRWPETEVIILPSSIRWQRSINRSWMIRSNCHRCKYDASLKEMVLTQIVKLDDSASWQFWSVLWKYAEMGI